MANSIAKFLAATKLMRSNNYFYLSARLKTSSTDEGFKSPKYEGQAKERKHIETARFPGEMDPNVVTLGKIYDKKPFRIELEAGKKYFWCACGHSKNQPFCDGTHKTLENFKPVAFTVDADKKYSLCLCKRTAKQPFCDGTHRRSDEVKDAVCE